MESSHLSLEYTLGPENIASEPHEVRLGRRDLGRMLVVDRQKGATTHATVGDFPDWFGPGDVLVLNDSKRRAGVLIGRTDAEGAQIELRFVKVEEDQSALCRPFPQHFIKVGCRIKFKDGTEVDVVEAGIEPHSLCRIRTIRGDLSRTLDAIGKPITSFFYTGYWDIENYNTFYAREEGSVESPMAGLHLTPELLGSIEARGASVCYLTLHVVGSWLPPVSGQKLMMPEPYTIPSETAALINRAKNEGKFVTACGSTVVRALESAYQPNRGLQDGPGKTDLLLKPGSPIRVVDRYFTNFHPSKSSLMLLDAAICEPGLLLSSYQEAAKAGYLFFEFGDAVFYI